MKFLLHRIFLCCIACGVTYAFVNTNLNPNRRRDKLGSLFIKDHTSFELKYSPQRRYFDREFGLASKPNEDKDEDGIDPPPSSASDERARKKEELMEQLRAQLDEKKKREQEEKKDPKD